jgi:hypothetical protein
MLQRTTLTNNVTGCTTASILFLSPVFLPLKSRFYGAECPSGFNISRIYDFHGKKWQLRTVTFRGKSYIVPFVINSGGVNSRAPIVGTPLRRKIGALPPGVDRVAWGNRGRVTVPSPLGELVTISDWDRERRGIKSPTLDERYNLIGQGWAQFIFEVNAQAGHVNGGAVSFSQATERLIEDCDPEIVKYVSNPHNKKRIERELRAMMAARKDERNINQLAEAWATNK